MVVVLNDSVFCRKMKQRGWHWGIFGKESTLRHLVRLILLFETIKHHPSQIDHIQDDHEIADGSGKPPCGKKLVRAPQEKRETHYARFEQIQEVRAGDELKA